MISNESPLRKTLLFDWFILSFSFLLSFVLGALVMNALTPQLGIDDLNGYVSSISATSSMQEINAVRIIQMVSHIFTFWLPSLFFIGFVYKVRPFKRLFLNRLASPKFILLGILLIILAFPAIQLIYYWNRLIPLPESFQLMELGSKKLFEAFLVMDSPSILWFNVLVVGVIPAIGEELLFRGVLQRIFYKTFSNPHLAIWVTAFLFSAIHMQFAGFFPRLILGALLGYLLYWTGSLWVPILAHFVNNAGQVITQYFLVQSDSSTHLENMDYFPWYVNILTIIISGLIIYLFQKQSKENQLYYEQEVGSDIQ